MARYHINPKTGNPGICRAKKSCPFGNIETEHFDSQEAARSAYEMTMASAAIPELTQEKFEKWLQSGRKTNRGWVLSNYGNDFRYCGGIRQVAALHPDYARSVLLEAKGLEEFQGANNHVQSFEVQNDPNQVIIHFNQKRTWFHSLSTAIDHDEQRRQGIEGSMLTSVVKEPDSVPNETTKDKVPSRSDLSLLSSAFLVGEKPRWMADRGLKTLARFEGGKQTEEDVKEAIGALRFYGTAPRRRSTPRAAKALDLGKRLQGD